MRYVPRGQAHLVIRRQAVRPEGLYEVGSFQTVDRRSLRTSDLFHRRHDPELSGRFEPPGEKIEQGPGPDSTLLPGHDRVELLLDGSKRATSDSGNRPLSLLFESLREAARRVHKQNAPRALERESAWRGGDFQSGTS